MKRAVVLGGLQAWRDGLATAGVETVPEVGRETPELVVAPARLASQALGLRPEMVVLEDGRLRAPRARDWSERVLLLLPDLERPELLLPAGAGDAVRYAVRHWRGGGRAVRSARNVIAAELLAHGIVPPGRSATTVASRTTAPPFFVASALEALPVDDVDWFAAFGRWADASTRGAFYLFAPGEAEPGWVVKFARVPGLRRLFDEDEQGLRVVERAGVIAAAHAPQLVERFETGGLEASIETAAIGSRLSEVLRSPRRSRNRVTVLERIAAWIVELARETSSPPDKLEPELRRLAADVIPRWTQHGLPRSLVDDLPPLGAVLQHGDLWAENIFVGPHHFTVIDWELVQAHGMPLWDLFYFLTDALAIVAGVGSEGEREEHFVRLWRGDLPSSELLFRWTRVTVEASGIPPEAVGPVATLLWLSHALRDVARSDRRDESPHAIEPSTLRFARRWLSESALGYEWNRWRS